MPRSARIHPKDLKAADRSVINQPREILRLCRGDRRSLTFFRELIGKTLSCEPPSTQHRRLPMDEAASLSHSRWECKYEVVFIPKYRRKVVFGRLRRRLGEVFHGLARRKESRIEEGHLMPDHMHMLISIPPKYALSQVVGYIKGESAIHIAKELWKAQA